MMDGIIDALGRTWTDFHARALRVFPRLLAALAVFLAGLAAAALLRALVRRILRMASFDQRMERSGLAQPLHRTCPAWSATELGAGAAFWVTVLSAAIFSLSALEMPLLDRMIEAFFLYLPKVFLAGLTLALGFLASNFLWRAALLVSVNEELPAPRLLAGTVRLLANLLVLAMALEQLDLARATVTAAFTIVFGAVMLALALAFGLGGRDLAREFLARKLKQEGQEGREEVKHL